MFLIYKSTVSRSLKPCLLRMWARARKRLARIKDNKTRSEGLRFKVLNDEPLWSNPGQQLCAVYDRLQNRLPVVEETIWPRSGASSKAIHVLRWLWRFKLYSNQKQKNRVYPKYLHSLYDSSKLTCLTKPYTNRTIQQRQSNVAEDI